MTLFVGVIIGIVLTLAVAALWIVWAVATTKWGP